MSAVPEFDLEEVFGDLDFAVSPTAPSASVPVIDPSPVAPAPAQVFAERPKPVVPRPTIPTPLPTVKLDSREVEKALGSVVQAVTGALSKFRPYFEMTDAEFKGIVGPVSRHLVKKAPESPRVMKAVNNLDWYAGLANIGIYFTRVGIETATWNRQRSMEQAQRRTAKVVDIRGNPMPPDEPLYPNNQTVPASANGTARAPIPDLSSLPPSTPVQPR